MKKLMVILVFLIFASTVAVSSVPVEEVKCRQFPVHMKIVENGDSINRTTDIVTVKAGDYFKVVLEASGGTGYRWELMNKDLFLIEVVDKSATPVDKFLHMPGGRVRWVFYLRMKEDAVGQEALQFRLIRGSEEASEFSLKVAVQE